MSAALVAVTEQVPAEVTLSDAPDTVQPLAVPSVAVYETAPLPEPPLVVSVSALPAVPLVEVTLRAACVALANVTVVGFEETEE